MKWYQKSLGIFALLIFFFPVGLFLMWKYASWNNKIKGVITGAFAVSVVLVALLPPSQSSTTQESASKVEPKKVATIPAAEKAAQETTAKKKAEANKPLSTVDKLWKAVDSGLKKRDSIKIDYDSTEKIGFIEHTDENPYNAESFVRQAYSILVLWGQEAFKVDGVDSINVQNKTKFIDSYGKESVSTGVTIEMTKEQFNKFTWKNFEYVQVNKQVRSASTIYIIVPAINSQIKDESKLYLTLTY